MKLWETPGNEIHSLYVQYLKNQGLLDQIRVRVVNFFYIEFHRDSFWEARYDLGFPFLKAFGACVQLREGILFEGCLETAVFKELTFFTFELTEFIIRDTEIKTTFV